MKLEIKKGSENYAATIVEIDNIHPIKDADLIVRTVVFGNDVIVNKDTQIGTKMIYFNGIRSTRKRRNKYRR